MIQPAGSRRLAAAGRRRQLPRQDPSQSAPAEAMEVSRKTSPFYERWVEQQQPTGPGRAARAGNRRRRTLLAVAAVAEHNCLKMHSVMWGSRPPMTYWNSATVACMQTVRDLQADDVGVFFTIDAGPQLKAICAPEFADEVRAALAATVGVSDVMLSGIGEGAELLAT